MFVHSAVTMLKKTQNYPFSDFFNLTPKYILPLLPYTDCLLLTTKYRPVLASTDPVLSYINQHHPKLTHYHQVSTNKYCTILTQYHQARSLNCHHPPVSLVGRFRLGGQVLLDIENLSLAPRWAETISTTKALVTQ